MRQTMIKKRPDLRLILVLSVLWVLGGTKIGWSQSYEAYFLYHGAYPEEEETPFSDEFQGLTHDEDNWFLSSNRYELVDPQFSMKIPQLWKIPLQYNLRHVTDDTNQYPGVIRRRITETPLWGLDYNHFGDISYYKYGNQGYILVPVEDETRPYEVANIIAIFKADDLAYVDKAEVRDLKACKDSTARSLGWVAVDPQGYVYTTGDCVYSIFRYKLNWADLTMEPAELSEETEINLFDENGYPLFLGRTQGGVFSESGGLLYMLTGSEDTDYRYPNDGISVFNKQTWRRVKQSDQSDNCIGNGPFFCYHYDPGWSSYEEPEGITVWDLDKRCGADPNCAPGIRGQLHVGLLDNEFVHDEFYLYHYINTIYVNSSYAGSDPSTGEPHKPFKTITKANGVIWDGARINIAAGSYAEALTFSKQIQVLAGGGTVTVGVASRFSLTPSAAVYLYTGGRLKID